MENEIEIITAATEADFLQAKELILEYTEWLNVDLSFQNFDAEMQSLHKMYNKPFGALFIAIKDGKAIGVVGLRQFSQSECEMKRMFVKPEGRGLGIGKLLVENCIAMGKSLHYATMKLDTTNLMQSAIRLYIENGFAEIPAYRFNPDEGARYFELDLT